MSKKRKYIIPFVIIIILTVGYFIADSILFDGVKPKVINVNGFQAKYFAKDNLDYLFKSQVNLYIITKLYNIKNIHTVFFFNWPEKSPHFIF